MGVLARAEMLMQAKNYSGSGDWLDEANSHDGTIDGALFHPYAGIRHIFVPGVAANYVSAANAANNAHDNLTDVWLAGRFAMTDWTPTVDQTLIAKWEDTSDQRSYRLMVDTTGVLRLGWSTDGTAANVVEEDSTVAPTVSNGDKLWVAGTVDISAGTVKFYVGGVEGTPVWTQLGATVSGSGASSMFDSTAVLEVGTDNTGTAQLFIGEVYNAQVEDGFDEGVGTLQFDADFTDVGTVKEPYATFTEASANAATVTFNRSTTARKLINVDEPVFSLAVNDAIQVADDAALDFGTTDDFTIMLVGRTYRFVSGDAFIDKSGGFGASDQGYRLFETSTSGAPKFEVASGVAEDSITGPTVQGIGIKYVVAGVRDAGTNINAFADGVAGTPVTDNSHDLATALDLHAGKLTGGANFREAELFAWAVWAEALSDADVIAAGNEFSAAGANTLLLMNTGV